MKTELPELSVSEFVAVLNQTLEYAYPSVVITGELVNFRVSRGRWVYFDLKDEFASVKCFGTVYSLSGPLEDGMTLRVVGQPKLHPLYGFSFNISKISPVGEGSIVKAAQLLQAKLSAEGLFDGSRKRSLPYPPVRLGLITSKQAAAYADFIKVLDARWRGIEIDHIDVQVQGEIAPEQIVAAIEQFNSMPEPHDVVVLIRGGGSAEDLAAFNTEQVTRAVATSRVPMLVAIGHETDLSLAELAADQRASTPSNAAELLVPDREAVEQQLDSWRTQLVQTVDHQLELAKQSAIASSQGFAQAIETLIERSNDQNIHQAKLLEALNPQSVLKRGYAIVRSQGRPVRNVSELAKGDIIDAQLADGILTAEINSTRKQ